MTPHKCFDCDRVYISIVHVPTECYDYHNVKELNLPHDRPKKVYTEEEFKENRSVALKSAEEFGGIKIVDDNGKCTMAMSIGSRDTSCIFCGEVPRFCIDARECVESWKERAFKAEESLDKIMNKLNDIIVMGH